MAWDEWEQLKSEAAGRSPDGPTPGGQQADLKSSKQAWLTAGEGVGSLRTSIGSALTKLRQGQAGLTTDPGCLTATAQREVYGSWQQYIGSVDKRRNAFQAALRQAGNDQQGAEQSVIDRFHALKVPYADTDAVGGNGNPPKGR